jgi:hypothetical protein
MKNKFHHIQGVTLLEALLGLVIIATIAMMSLRYYQRYATERDFKQIENNVDILFQTLRRFYQANCQSGVLSPFPSDPSVPAPDLTMPFPMENDAQFQDYLLTPGFLPKQWPFYNVQVDDTFGYKGYAVKLIPIVNEITRKTTSCYQFDKSKTPQCYNGLVPGRKVLYWKIEIAVQVLNVNNAQAFGPYIGTNCIVDSWASDVPVNCTVDNSTDGTILVWQFLPSDPFLRPRSDAWLMNPIVKNFNLLYTHDPMYEMYHPNSGPITGDNYHYYLCGG